MSAIMRTVRSLFSLTPHQLVAETRSLLAARAENTAELLEHLAEIDSRRLFVEEAYTSTQAYCVGVLGMSEDSAEKKIAAARAVRRVPSLLDAVADRRLHVSAVVLLAPRIDGDNADELIALASRRSCAEIRARLAERERLAAPTITPPLLAQVVAKTESEPDSNPVMSSTGYADEPRATVAVPTSPPRVISFTVPAELADAYREALALAPYEVAHDPAQAFAAMLAAWREKLAKRRCGEAARRRAHRTSGNARHVPVHVRAEVWRRDGGRCTYTSDAGRRCEHRDQLELDHVTPIARGGTSTADNLRLRCRAHNQLEAERAFGRGFIEARREEARAARDAARAERERLRAERDCRRAEEAQARAAADEVVPALRSLGLGANEARAVAMRIALPPDAPLDQRVLAAVRMLGPRGARPSVFLSGGTS